MDRSQLPWGNDAFGNNNNPLFADSQQFNTFDHLFQNDADPSVYETTWNPDFSDAAQSRAPANNQAWLNPQQPQQQQHQQPPHQHQPQQHLQQHPHSVTTASNHLNGQRSLSHSPAPYGQNAFHNYGVQQNYQQYWQQPHYDPSLVAPPSFAHQPFSFNTNFDAQAAPTIAPQALQQEPQRPPQPQPSTFSRPTFERPAFQVNDVPIAQPQPVDPFRPKLVDQAALAAKVPAGKSAGYFSIVDYDELSKSTNSERMTAFLNVGKEALEWNVTRAALPAYVPRKSRNDLRKLAENDPKLLARLGKKVIKKPSSVPKQLKPVMPQSQERVKYEDEVSSEAESSSSEDDDSSYSSDSDAEDSPLPTARPTGPAEATEYDTIKALWRPKRKTLGSESIRKGIVDFWEIIKTIRDRWKADSTALAEAKDKNRKNELSLLETRVKDQRIMMEVAFKAALKHGHRNIIELLAGNTALVFLCYQFLLDRSKDDDYNSTLPRTLLEIMSLFTTLTEEAMEKTHLIKVLPRYIKRGDAKTQYYAKRIASNAANASKQKATEQLLKKPTTGATSESTLGSPLSKRPNPEPVAGVKRAANTAGDSTISKKLSTTSIKGSASPSTKLNGVTKKPAVSTDTTKTTGAISTGATKPKQVVARPSGFFSSLQSAGKKPGTSITNKTAQSSTTTKPTDKVAPSSTSATVSAAPKSTFSFADTMAALSKPKEEKQAPKPETQLPPENPEQKARRLRKEARRQLHVSFKAGDDLVEIRYFTHDPEEEVVQDSSQMRDVADVGGEGRMFKQQHQLMDIDDDDDMLDVEQPLIDFTLPKNIDFSVIDSEERSKNYAAYGGGHAEVESTERSVREAHEANTLIIVYANPTDIPPNPHEPLEPYSGPDPGPIKKFGSPEEGWQARARSKKTARQAQNQTGLQSTAAPAFDFAKFASYTNNSNPIHAPPQSQPQPQPQSQPQVPSSDALSSILASLRQNMANPPPPPQHQNSIGGFDGTYQPPPPSHPFNAPVQPSSGPPSGQPDLAAILATLKQQSSAPGPSSGSYNVPQNSSSGNDDQGRGSQRPQGSHPFWRTKTCMYWQQGKCQKGEMCSYKHED